MTSKEFLQLVGVAFVGYVGGVVVLVNLWHKFLGRN